ncbi:hypothetical protein SAMN05443575_1460 [Jatrophihabitans endophyticus]|uniref:Uncharacterized protein n=1 Tax=Jatrophihabitans endophyticus TaxID=1206085 RepID=A0A1M5HBC7_9ACTN|nr:hypothetical protein [Jatrophihabitans endophyticus]SHG13254.1 hypothetical protein SAMN05443575_1460 [Jatrophihabitans endophyticus]
MKTIEAESLLDTMVSELAARNALLNRIARSRKLLADHGVTAADFLDALDPDETQFFLTCPPALLRAEVRQWLAMMRTRPDATYDDRRARVQHGYERRFQKIPTSDRENLAAMELRLRTAFILRDGILRYEPYDAPQAPVQDFLAWLTPEAVRWGLALPIAVFKPAVRAWLEKYANVVARPRLVDAPVPSMHFGDHERFLTSSHHFDLRVRRLAEELEVRFGSKVPPAPTLAVSIIDG